MQLQATAEGLIPIWRVEHAGLDQPSTPDHMTFGLPKWPALTVQGAPIYPDLATCILLRTQPTLLTNARDFAVAAYEALGMPLHAAEERDGYSPRPDGFDYSAHYEALTAESRAAGKLELEYLDNARIVSSWVGGPKGWCDWDGTIGCNTFNIGKYPSAEAVLGDWTLIAAAFPFLKLSAQLWSGETCEEGIVPVVEYIVHGRTVTMQAPTQVHPRPVSPPVNFNWTDSEAREVGVPGATRQERLAFLRRAATRVKESLE